MSSASSTQMMEALGLLSHAMLLVHVALDWCKGLPKKPHYAIPLHSGGPLVCAAEGVVPWLVVGLRLGDGQNGRNFHGRQPTELGVAA